ncbi:DoxX family protein [Leptospira sp. 96542]|nr:DoxX family protein [Leptospira sp. 96542]
MNKRRMFYHLARVLSILILGQTLYFKFTGASESIFIFSTLGMEPWGRYVLAGFETFTILMLLIPRLVWLGAIIGLNLMFGAILSHFVFLGIIVQNDNGLLFFLATCVFLFTLYLFYHDRKEVPILKNYFE